MLEGRKLGILRHGRVNGLRRLINSLHQSSSHMGNRKELAMLASKSDRYLRSVPYCPITFPVTAPALIPITLSTP